MSSFQILGKVNVAISECTVKSVHIVKWSFNRTHFLVNSLRRKIDLAVMHIVTVPYTRKVGEEASPTACALILSFFFPAVQLSTVKSTTCF